MHRDVLCVPRKYYVEHILTAWSYARMNPTQNLKGRTMGDKNNPATLGNTSTRRQMIAGVAIAFGSLAAGSEILGKPQQQTMQEKPSTSANQTRTSLHH